VSKNQKITWGPTENGATFTGSRDWSFELEGTRFKLKAERQEWTGTVLDLRELKVDDGFVWASIEFPFILPWTLDRRVKVDGIPNVDAVLLDARIRRLIEAEDARVAAQARRLVDARPTLLKWADETVTSCEEQFRRRGWLTRDFTPQKPARPTKLTELLEDSAVLARLIDEPEDVKRAIKLWTRDYDELNARLLSQAKVAEADFFRRVESRPLTDEQIDAVACFDNRVLVVAAAGSGKTSTMVSKAGYAVHKGYFAPEKILLLAFNNDAAAQLRKRLKARLEPLGIPTDRLTAKTFHAFGLDVLGEATGKRPSLAPWLEGGKDLEVLFRIVEDLKANDAQFRVTWDLLRVVFGNEPTSPLQIHEAARTFQTLNDERVKSRGEQVIADWLFFNGVEYAYEQEYEHNTASTKHRQYRPDFYLPAAHAYLEHWALDEHGNPPPAFEGYKEGMQWKKGLHKLHGTVLFETTSAQLWSGEAFSYLERELTRLGVTLDPNPDRPPPGRKPIEARRLTRTFRTFHTHAKSNRLSIGELRARLQTREAGDFKFRHTMFLMLYEQLASGWEARLRGEGNIDFEDMLQLAADHIDAGTWSGQYDLVMVDEFQDASRARARILTGLVSRPGSCLFAVGDDWQSINRFAGADLSVMTLFDRIYGAATTLRLQRTFRCTQGLCDISSAFVQMNPRQLSKKVSSVRSDVSEPVRIVRVANIKAEGRAAVQEVLEAIPIDASNRRVTVFLLGRYKNDERYLPTAYDREKLDVRFATVHASKGLEADHVIVPGLTSDTLGFPSSVTDDPVLQLAMPEAEDYPNAEERRLFYVALTRAKYTVTLITQQGKESAFISELLGQHGVKAYDRHGAVSEDIESCPACGEGLLVKRKSKYGEFLGCSQFPRCSYTRDLSGQRKRSRFAA
jgi:DNA helicase IV